MLRTRGFLHITYLLFHHLDKVSGPKKANCLSVYLSLMKYCWKSNHYTAGLRHSTIQKDTGLSRTTIHRTLLTLAKLNIISTIKGRSGKTYKINTKFVKFEKDMYKNETALFQKYTPNVSNVMTLVESLDTVNNKDNKNSKITGIILSCNGSKEDSVKKLKTLPTPELLKGIELKDNPWYCKLALAEKESEGKGKVFVDPQIIVNSLKKISKESNFAYKKKKEFNIRNNIKPWEDKK